MDIAFLNIAIYVVVNLLLFSSWYLLLFRKTYCLSFIDRLIGTFTLGLTQIILTEILLGVFFKKLFAAPLFWVNISISLVVLVLAITLDRRETFSKKKGNIKTYFLKDIIHELKDETIGIFRIIKKDRVLFCIFSLFFISVCWMVFLGYLFPSYTWDALWYHLPIVGYIIQSGAIQENATASIIDLFINIFPKNIELFFVWNTIFLKNDIITDLSQLLFTITGVFTIYSIAIKLGLKEKYALYSSFLFFFTPVVILQSTTNYVDIAVSVLFLVAINFLIYDNPENSSNSEAGPIPLRERKIPILLAGLATGILLGSKGSGPLFVIVLLGILLIREFIKRFNPFKLFYNFPSNVLSSRCKGYSAKDSFILYFIYFIIPAFLIGGYWYIKNWILYGNPVYPIEVSFFNITLFKGLFEGIIDPTPAVIDRLTLLNRPFYVWLERVKYYLYDSRLSGFGPVWFILLLPSIATALFYTLKRKRYNFLFISTILIITFIIHPRNWYTRYVIFILGLGSLSFGLTLNYFKERQKAIKIIALLLVIYTFFTANSPCIMPWKIGEFMRLPAKERIIARHAPFNIDLQARQEYGLWIWINNNMSEGNTLVHTFEPLFLSPLWNRSFSNKVIYIKSENYNEWIKNLRSNHATHVLIKQNSIEDKWIQKVKRLIYNSPSWLGISERFLERFKVVYSDKNYKVLSVRLIGVDSRIESYRRTEIPRGLSIR